MATVKHKDEIIPLLGADLEVGDNAPVVRLKTKLLANIEIGNSTQIIMSIPSLDTPVCAEQARVTNERLASFKNIQTIIVTMDLPFAIDRFCSVKDIDNLIVASDFAYRDFGIHYGVLMGKSVFEGLLTRAIFVVKDGKVVYKQLVPEVMQKPNLQHLEDFITNTYGVYPRIAKRI